MKKFILPFLCFALCACSSEGKNEPLTNKVSFEEAKQFILSHPLESFKTHYLDITGNEAEGNIYLFSSYGTSCTIEVIENTFEYDLNSKNYKKSTYHFDYNKKFAFKKSEYVSTKYCQYEYVHILNDNEYELITAVIEPSVESAKKEIKQIPESEKQIFLDEILYQFNCPLVPNIKFCLVNYINVSNGELTEADYSKDINSYEFSIENETLTAKTKIKMVYDKNGRFVKGKEKVNPTDEIVMMSSNYTINSKGICTDGLYGCSYHGNEYIGYKIKSGALDESLFSNEFNDLKQLVQQYE